MEFMDVHVKKTAEEIREAADSKNRKGGDPNKKARLDLFQKSKDISFGIYANVAGTNMGL